MSAFIPAVIAMVILGGIFTVIRDTSRAAQQARWTERERRKGEEDR